MEQFIGTGISGIPYGCTYAMVAVGLVLTYQATGVFNFAFGAQAFASAFIFTWLVQEHGFPVWASFVLSVIVLGPVLGLTFDRLLFRHIPSTNTTAKIVTGIALLVGIPSLLPVVFGNENLYNAPSVLFNINTVYLHIAGQPINGISVSSVLFTAVVLVALVVLMRCTSLGLQMRAAVESRRLVQLDGVNAGGVVAVAWAISSVLAGLAGVLLAPLNAQVQSQDYVTLMVAAIAAAAWGALRSMPVAAVVGIAMGVVEFELQDHLPTSSIWYTALLPSFPFIVLVVALLVVPGLRRLDDARDPLAGVDPPAPPTAASIRLPSLDRIVRPLWYLLLAAFVVSMLTWMPATWENVFNQGLAFSTIFLSITLITGMGGQLSLGQATLAGVGAFSTAQLANHLGIPMIWGVFIGATLAAMVAVVLAVLSLRLRGLGLALMTLAAALFFDNTVFSENAVTNGQTGLTLKQGWIGPINFFSLSEHAYFILAMCVLTVCVLAILQIRKGTTGRYLAAMRGSEVGSAGLGINLTWQRILVFALSGVVAGIGGTLLVVNVGAANADQFNYQLGLAFVVIVVTTGVGTVEGAIQGGIGFVVVQQLLTYAPERLQGLTFVLFAFGALTYVAHPEGVVEYQKRRWGGRVERLVFKHAPEPSPDGGPDASAALAMTSSSLSGAGGGPSDG